MSDPIDRELLRAFDLDRAGKSFEESLFDLDHAEMWVRLGVADSEVSETIFKYCEILILHKERRYLRVKFQNE